MVHAAAPVVILITSKRIMGLSRLTGQKLLACLRQLYGATLQRTAKKHRNVNRIWEAQTVCPYKFMVLYRFDCQVHIYI